MHLGVEAVGISKSYGVKVALSDVSLKVEPGGLLAVLGPSGSGKSTLLRILGLLERQNQGDVKFSDSGDELNDREKLRRSVTMLLQRSVMLKDSVFANVAYGLRVRGLDEKELKPKVEGALAGVGLEGYAKRRATTLSGGEMQRVAFARAAVVEPKLLLLDEFTANLDPPNIRMLESALTEFMKRTGCTVVLVSHNPFQARRLSQDCIFLYEGRILSSGRIDRLGDSEDERIAAFFRGETI